MLELKQVSFDVSGQEKEIIRGIDLTIPDNKLVVVTGPNGGGKSTLARLIAGIEMPTGGQILLDGEDITGLSVTERARRGIGFAFQQPVRFKGIRVLDLIRIAAGRHLSVADACRYLSAVGLCARESTARSTPACRAASSSASKSPRCWRANACFRSLTSPRRASTCGASRT